MNAVLVIEPAPDAEAESASIATISVALMVLMGMLSALFVIGAWGLVVAGLVAAASKFGISLWLALVSLSLLHVLGAWLLWRGAVKLSRYLNFTAARQQFQNLLEAESDVDSAATTR